MTWVALHGLGRDYLNARVLVPTVALLTITVSIAAGVLALTALRTYPRDVATAAESHRQQTNTRAGN
ncbi:MAG: hypothetical protein ACRDQJ_05615 [Pseudonocardiaceae bacterium]